MDIPCDNCARLDRDLIAVMRRLLQLKREKWKGFVEYRLDGSGCIVSVRMHSYEEIEEHGKKRPGG